MFPYVHTGNDSTRGWVYVSSPSINGSHNKNDNYKEQLDMCDPVGFICAAICQLRLFDFKQQLKARRLQQKALAGRESVLTFGPTNWGSREANSGN